MFGTVLVGQRIVGASCKSTCGVVQRHHPAITIIATGLSDQLRHNSSRTCPKANAVAYGTQSGSIKKLSSTTISAFSLGLGNFSTLSPFYRFGEPHSTDESKAETTASTDKTTSTAAEPRMKLSPDVPVGARTVQVRGTNRSSALAKYMRACSVDVNYDYRSWGQHQEMWRNLEVTWFLRRHAKIVNVICIQSYLLNALFCIVNRNIL